MIYIYILPIVTNWWVLQPLTVSLKKSALEAALPPAPVPQVPQVGSRSSQNWTMGTKNSKKGQDPTEGLGSFPNFWGCDVIYIYVYIK